MSKLRVPDVPRIVVLLIGLLLAVDATLNLFDLLSFANIAPGLRSYGSGSLQLLFSSTQNYGQPANLLEIAFEAIIIVESLAALLFFRNKVRAAFAISVTLVGICVVVEHVLHAAQLEVGHIAVLVLLLLAYSFREREVSHGVSTGDTLQSAGRLFEPKSRLRSFSKIILSYTARLPQDRRVGLCFCVIIAIAFGALLFGQGFYAFGDTDFPIRLWPLSTFLPFDSRSQLGYDNVYIGLPRIFMMLFENLLWAIFHNTAAVSFMFYSVLAFMGMWGVYSLLKRGSVPPFVAAIAGVLYVLNPWMAARISQTNVVIVYMAVPIFYTFVMDLLAQPRIERSARVGLFAPILLCAINMTYIAFVGTVVLIVVYQIVNNYNFARRVLGLGTAFAFGCGISAFFVLPALAEALQGTTGALEHVARYYSFASYRSFASTADFYHFIRYEGFLYAPWRAWPDIWQLDLTLLPIVVFTVAGFGVINLRALNSRARVLLLSGLMFVAISLFFTQGTLTAPRLVEAVWRAVPGLRELVDADYWGMLYSAGAVMLLASFPAITRWRREAPWLLLAGVLFGSAPFVPGLGLFAKANPPRIYHELPVTGDGERTLWEPQTWANHYTWSPYMLAGWPTVAVAGDSYGPYAAEIASRDSSDFSAYVHDQLSAAETRGLDSFLDMARTRYVLLTEDKVSDPTYAPYPESERAALNRSLDQLLDAGSFTTVRGLRVFEPPDDVAAKLLPQSRWYLKYVPASRDDFAGDFRGRLGLTPLSSLRRNRAWPADTISMLPISITELPVAGSQWRTGLCEPHSDARIDGSLDIRGKAVIGTVGHHLRCASLSIVLPAGVNALEIPTRTMDAVPSGTLVTKEQGRQLILSSDGSLRLTVRAVRPQLATLFVYVAPGRRGQVAYGPVRDTLWPSGRFEILGLDFFPKDIRAAFARAEREARHVRILRAVHSLSDAVFVAHSAVATHSSLDRIPVVARYGLSDAILAEPVRLRTVPRIEALGAGDSLLSVPDSANLTIQYIPMGVAPVNATAVIDGKAIPATSLLTKRNVSARRIELLPLSHETVPFNSRAWIVGVCDGTKSGTGSLSFSGGFALGRAGTRTWCMSRTEEWAVGVHSVSVGVKAIGLTPRGLIQINGDQLPLDWNASGTMTSKVVLGRRSTVQIFLYVDTGPRTNEIRFTSFEDSTWPSGNVLVGTASHTPPAPSARLLNLQRRPLSYSATLEGCDSGCIVVAAWSFSPIWKANVGGEDLTHVHANGYANAWVVPPQRGPSTIKVYYAVGIVYYVGLVLSTLSMVFLALLALRSKHRAEL